MLVMFEIGLIYLSGVNAVIIIDDSKHYTMEVKQLTVLKCV